MPAGYLGFLTPGTNQWLDLAAWRQTHGWDKNGAVASLELAFDPDRLELTMSSREALPKVSVFNHIDNDMFGNATGETRPPGPFADPGARRVWQVDPRSMLRQQTESGGK
jgi:hypothetical protein